MDFDPLSDNEEDVTFMPEKKKKDKEGKKYLKHNIKQTTCFLFINISFISIFKCIPVSYTHLTLPTILLV